MSFTPSYSPLETDLQVHVLRPGPDMVMQTPLLMPERSDLLTQFRQNPHASFAEFETRMWLLEDILHQVQQLF